MFGIEQPTTDLSQVLRREDVQVVAVATPPTSHAEITLEALRAGKHVMCEKPFAHDAAEAQRMLDTARQAGVVHLLGAEFRFAQGQGLLSRTIRSGAIGEPTYAVFMLHVPTLSDPSAQMPAWRDDIQQGGGWLNQQAPHVIDQIRNTIGEIGAVSATLKSIASRPGGAEDTYTIQFQTTSGAGGVLHGSCAVAGPPSSMTKIIGTRGSAWLQDQEVWVDTGDGPKQVPAAEDLPFMRPAPVPSELIKTTYDAIRSTGVNLAPYVRLYEVMGARICGRAVPDDPVAATFVDGLANQLVIDAVRASATALAWVDVPATTTPA
jgi:predicted dehydrogenase